MFYDEARIYLKSGDGGNGMISFRREKFVPFGGPDGGDGGHGGDIVFVVNPKINSLAYFHRKVHFRAEPGVRGGSTKKYGRRGEALVLEVPPGTIIRDAETAELLADLTESHKKVVFIPGGRGGRGNVHFSTSTNQAPNIAERGEPGEDLWVKMELKLIADVGLAGKPNAGKSTLLAAVSSAKPKIAAYPFTTLQPNLGVVSIGDYDTLVMADIPGLIEGAASGVGLGHDFLRHIERTQVLIHLLDGSAPEPLEDWAAINQELSLYDIALEEKPQLVVFNKIDLPDAQAWEPLVEERVREAGYDFCTISAVTGQGVREMLFKVKQMLDEIPEAESVVGDEVVVIRPKEDPNQFTVTQEGPNDWRVSGKRIEKVASMTYFEFDAAARRFQHILESMGITKALEKAGVEPGDMVSFGDIELEWQSEELLN